MEEIQSNKKQISEIASRQNLTAAITTGDKHGVSVAIKAFKLPNGAVNYPAILSIPLSERLPQMAKNSFRETSTIVTAALTLAMEGMNLKNPMNPIQILDLSEAIIDTADEDNLSLEDVVLFLQKLVRGEYGKLYESIDLPKFMEFFEIYRLDRHNALNEYRLNKHLEYKGMGDTNRSTVINDLDEHFASFTGRLNEMKDKLKDK